jgi:siderophore synthetase component
MDKSQVPSKYIQISEEMANNNCAEIASIIDDAVSNDENTTWEAVQMEIYNGMDNLINEARRVQQTLCK